MPDAETEDVDVAAAETDGADELVEDTDCEEDPVDDAVGTDDGVTDEVGDAVGVPLGGRFALNAMPRNKLPDSAATNRGPLVDGFVNHVAVAVSIP